jgi:hypothetical protein
LEGAGQEVQMGQEGFPGGRDARRRCSASRHRAG